MALILRSMSRQLAVAPPLFVRPASTEADHKPIKYTPEEATHMFNNPVRPKKLADPSKYREIPKNFHFRHVEERDIKEVLETAQDYLDSEPLSKEMGITLDEYLPYYEYMLRVCTRQPRELNLPVIAQDKVTKKIAGIRLMIVTYRNPADDPALRGLSMPKLSANMQQYYKNFSDTSDQIWQLIPKMQKGIYFWSIHIPKEYRKSGLSKVLPDYDLPYDKIIEAGIEATYGEITNPVNQALMDQMGYTPVIAEGGSIHRLDGSEIKLPIGKLKLSGVNSKHKIRIDPKPIWMKEGLVV